MNKPIESSSVIEKLENRIEENIVKINHLATDTNFADLAWFLSMLHVLRLRQIRHGPDAPKEPDADYTSLVMYEESMKYVAQSIVKYGSISNRVEDEVDYLVSRAPVFGEMIRHANIVHSTFTSLSIVSLCHDYLSINDKGQVEIEMGKAFSDPNISPYYDYFKRIELHIEVAKWPIKAEDYVDYIVENFSGFEDLFEAVFQIPPSDFAQLISSLLNSVVESFSEIQGSLPFIDDEFIDHRSPQYALAWGESLIINRTNLQRSFEKDISTALGYFVFSPEEYDTNVLTYHQVYRTPLFSYSEESFVVSPELLLDSLNSNTHYSLLEADPRINEEYKRRAASRFVDRIAEVCSEYGFQEIGRELELSDGATQLGDIDLVTQGPNDRFILVEAKYHMLPLDVYFKDLEATRKRLEYQQNDWENHFISRLQHLRTNSAKYGLTEDFEYILVSRMPEILSHFSEIMVLTLQELKTYLSRSTHPKSFESIFQILYAAEGDISREDLDQFFQDGLITIRPA